MLDIGLVGLDTSHPEAFARLIDQRDDATVAAVWDGGAVRDDEYVRQFCAQYDATRYRNPTGMLGTVDAVMILTVNWNTHRPLAVPFLEADVPTFIDKPIAGRHEDIDAIAAAAGDTPLFGGSAIPFHPRLTAFPTAQPNRTVYCTGYNDPFYYGVHLTDTVGMLVRDTWTRVTPKNRPGSVVDIEFENDSHVTLQLEGPNENPAFGILDVHDRTRTARIGSGAEEYQQMYGDFLAAFLDSVRGERRANTRILNSASLLLAVQTALRTNQVITPSHAQLAEMHVESDEFLADYAPYA
ncbi:Gfo/Idh/MocA family oxidoreductase [Haladaptatus sp. DYF46]|uniref:Gfo/Idh/MocA family oxidoreductase n=1 Tax=Haladaptatus sp. DYF46 TaxID=2886041 RepID=UPI001E2C1B22|nr:Gfo/Idh/MocA family oxidoreductase [Haladaptatus sp. DYF46]